MLVALFVFLNQSEEEKPDPFDNDYVMGLLQKERNLVMTVEQLNRELNDAEKEQALLQEKLDEAQLLQSSNTLQTQACESNNDNTTQSQAPGEKAPVAKLETCNAEKIDLNLAEAKIASLEKVIESLRKRLAEAQEESLQKDKLLAQARNQQNSEIEALKSEVDKLKRIISLPIALDKNYLGARYCDKPKFESLICVEEFLVRPSFTKPPITKLGIKIFDKTDTLVAKGEYNSAQNLLYRLSLGRGKELFKGDFTVQYSIDNQVIRSEVVELTQE